MNRLYAKTRHLPHPKSPKRHGQRPLKTLFVSAAITMAALVGYVAQVSSTANQSHIIQTLEQDIAGLKTEVARGEFHLAQEASVRSLEEKVTTLGMIPVGRVDYIVHAAVVARR